MLVNCFVFLIFSFIFICWSWDRPIVMRFIHICFDHRSFPFYYCFGLHNPRMKSLVEWASSKRFCTLKGLKSIQKLTNWTAKRRIKGTGHACSEKWIHWTTEFKWISIACSKKKNLFWGLLLFWKKKKKRRKILNFAINWFWDLCCHILLSLSHEWFPPMYFFSFITM